MKSYAGLQTINHGMEMLLMVVIILVTTAACGTAETPAVEIQTGDPSTEEPAPLPTAEVIDAATTQPVEEADSNASAQQPAAQSDPRIGVEADFAVRPIEAVFSSSGPPDLQVLSDSEAQLLFVSDIPLACSVVYGETTEYGMLTLDQDMAGGAHTDHHPILPDLKPDTLYHYRLQGSAEDGTIYMSENMTFRTPPAEEPTETNLASIEAGAEVIAVSSNFGGAANDETWGANNALDGSRASEWSSDGDGDGAFIEVALAERAQLDAIEIWTRSMSNDTAQIFEVTITTDSGEILGPYTLPNAAQAHRFEIDVVASTLRLEVTESNGGNTGLVEFAAYGTPVEEMN